MRKLPAFILSVSALALGCLVATETGCEYQRPACAVIKVADNVCTMVEYVDSTGAVHREPIASSDLVGLARASAARRTVDAGADASPVR